MEFEHIAEPASHAKTQTPTSGNKLQIIMASAIGVAAYFVFHYLLSKYYYGDPEVYQTYYDVLFGRNLLSAWFLQGPYLGSSEVIYPFIAWVCANSGIERISAMAAFDSIMYAIVFIALRRFKCNTIYIVLTLANFYLMVLATSAERLKFAYIFLFFALATTGRVRLAWLALAPMAHFQSLITQGSILIWHFFSDTSARIRFALIAAAIALSSAAAYFFFDALMAKFAAYQGQGSLVDLISGLALIAVAFVIFRSRFQILVAMVPLALLTLILGGARMNMITFTVFTYIALKEQKTGHPAVLLIMAYFSFKSIEYIRFILLYGNGFPI